MSYYCFRGMIIETKSLDRYIASRLTPGSFFHAVLANDLWGAVSKADVDNLPLIPAYVAYLYNFAPVESWGSYEAVAKWTSPESRLTPVVGGGQ